MENKKLNKLDETKSVLNIINRNKLSLSGVLEVVSFKDTDISLKTILGDLSIKGNELKMSKLDVQNGDISVVGNINSFNYTSKKNEKDNESILRRLFK